MDTPDLTTMKRCSKCGETKPLDYYCTDKSKKDGLSSHCRTCRNANARRYIAEHREKVRENQRKWNADNLEQVREARRKRYVENIEQERARSREYMKAWREEHPERAKEPGRKWRAKNRDYVKKRNAEYRAAHLDELREYYRAARRTPAYKLKIAARGQHRRAQLAGNGGSFTAADLIAIRASQTDKKGRLICWRCGKPIKGTPHLDHWIPLKHGGSNDAGNLHYMHAKCNLIKGSKHPTEIGRLI